jgi:hypothetical protein
MAGGPDVVQGGAAPARDFNFRGAAIQAKGAFPDLFLGTVMVMLFLIGASIDIETTEYRMGYGAQLTNFTPNWDILMQVPRILTGYGGLIPVSAAVAMITAWGFFTTALVGFIAYDHAIEAVEHANRNMGKTYKFVIWATTIADAVFNFLYSPAGSILNRIFFAVAVGSATYFGGLVGFRLLERGWRILRGK